METEFKFLIPPHRLAGVEAAMQQGHFTARRMQAHYFDTPDGDLARHGIAWRVRNEGGTWVQTVKTLGDGPLAREEHNADLPRPADPAEVPRPDASLHAGSAAGRQLEKVLAAAKAGVVETYGTEFERVTRELPLEGGGMVEIALDTGRVVAHRGTPEEASLPLSELELELKEGSVKALVQVASAWARSHGLRVSTVSKAERGECLRAGHAAGPATKAVPMRAKKHRLPSGEALQRAVVGNCLEQILPNASVIAQGHGDAGHVHQLRVGIRRLRTALRELDAFAPGRFDPDWQAPLRTAFRRLGELRDGEHVLESFDEALRASGGPAIAVHEPPSTSAQEVVGDGAFQAALIALMGFAAAGASAPAKPLPTGTHPPALDAHGTRRTVRKALRRLHRKIGKEAKGFAALPAETRHGVRKRIKRLRYLTEFFAPALQGRGRKFLRRLEPAQDALGHLNDEQVAEGLYRKMARRDPQAWFAVGWLAARRERTLAECQQALHRIGQGPEVRRHGFR